MCPAAGGTYSLGFFPIILWHPESGEEQPLQVMPRLQAARQDSWKGQHTRHSLLDHRMLWVPPPGQMWVPPLVATNIWPSCKAALGLWASGMIPAAKLA